jgi:hypothetical protein
LQHPQFSQHLGRSVAWGFLIIEESPKRRLLSLAWIESSQQRR